MAFRNLQTLSKEEMKSDEPPGCKFEDVKLKKEELDFLTYSPRENEENKFNYSENPVLNEENQTGTESKQEKTSNFNQTFQYVDVNNILANGNDRYKCPHCTYRTKWKHSLNLHITNIHTASEEINWFTCDYCVYKGKTKDHLNKHLLRHHEIKWHECTQCAFKSKRKQGLDFHIVSKHRSGEEINWFRCSYCPHKAKLKKHVIEHTRAMHMEDVHWYKCQMCSYQTKKNANLKSHVNSLHTADEEIIWFKCLWCSYKAKRKPDLTRHLKKHSSH